MLQLIQWRTLILSNIKFRLEPTIVLMSEISLPNIASWRHQEYHPGKGSYCLENAPEGAVSFSLIWPLVWLWCLLSLTLSGILSVDEQKNLRRCLLAHVTVSAQLFLDIYVGFYKINIFFSFCFWIAPSDTQGLFVAVCSVSYPLYYLRTWKLTIFFYWLVSGLTPCSVLKYQFL